VLQFTASATTVAVVLRPVLRWLHVPLILGLLLPSR